MATGELVARVLSFECDLGLYTADFDEILPRCNIDEVIRHTRCYASGAGGRRGAGGKVGEMGCR